jgi:hypothetical protein
LGFRDSGEGGATGRLLKTGFEVFTSNVQVIIYSVFFLQIDKAAIISFMNEI